MTTGIERMPKIIMMPSRPIFKKNLFVIDNVTIGTALSRQRQNPYGSRARDRSGKKLREEKEGKRKRE